MNGRASSALLIPRPWLGGLSTSYTLRWTYGLEARRMSRARRKELVELGMHASELLYAVCAISDEQRSRLAGRNRQLPTPTAYGCGLVSDVTPAHWHWIVGNVIAHVSSSTAGNQSEWPA